MISPHPQSMPAFAAVMGPVLVKLEKELKGITDGEGIIHKVYSFVDDTKAFIKNPEDLRTMNRIVERFEKISGMKMHRDKKKGKCQAFPLVNTEISRNGQNGLQSKRK